MGPYGDVIGLPFTLEAVSFFLEAIFIGTLLYGWRRFSARLHFLSLFPIVLSGIAGSFFILSANAWMNNPAGFRLIDGEVTGVDPWAAMFNSGVWVQYPTCCSPPTWSPGSSSWAFTHGDGSRDVETRTTTSGS